MYMYIHVYMYTLHVSLNCVVLDALMLWDVDGKFQIKVTQVTNLNVSKETSVRIERERRERGGERESRGGEGRGEEGEREEGRGGGERGEREREEGGGGRERERERRGGGERGRETERELSNIYMYMHV